MVTSADERTFSAWSLLSLTATAHGAPAYPDESEVCYVWDTTVPNGRYISPGDLTVIRDNRIVFGAGWIDSIESAPGRKVRYRCPNCTSTDFKYRTRHQFTYRCANCTTEFDVSGGRREGGRLIELGVSRRVSSRSGRVSGSRNRGLVARYMMSGPRNVGGLEKKRTCQRTTVEERIATLRA